MWIDSRIGVESCLWCDVGRDLGICQYTHRRLEFVWSSQSWCWLSLAKIALRLCFLFHKS